VGHNCALRFVFFAYPVPEKIIEIDVKASIKELKKRAEEKAKEEVSIKTERRESGE